MKGYKVRLIIPAQLSSDYNPADRIGIMKHFGADVEALDPRPYRKLLQNLRNEERAAAYVALRMKRCHELEKSDPTIWWANQLCNINNARAHRDTTGKEILEQLEGDVDAWVASIGTGGTMLGVADAIGKAFPSTRVVGVVPTDDPRIDWARSGAIRGFLETFDLPKMKLLTERILDKDLPDEVVTVTDVDAREMANRLCKEEGFFCGISSGANVFAAIKTARKLSKGTRIVTVLVDRRDRYFSEYPNEHYIV
ncbi:MAG: pyridoxal-phosphate dependent enzyme [Candidatus Bathyarchaeota archaeon]|nr:MAG: pyridoxal-phosphate dependent enzyme [Candidatus Bathyarchaeota archaeon]